MKVLFVGGDKRQLYMIEEFKKKGYKVELLGFDKLNTNLERFDIKTIDISKYDGIIFPVNGVYNDSSIKSNFNSYKVYLPIDFLEDVNDECQIFTGIMTSGLKKILKKADKKANVLMNNNEVTEPNAIITTEGIIKDIIENSSETIYGSNVMVIGYGNIGKRVTHIINEMGSNITVVVKHPFETKNIKYQNVITSEQIKNEVYNQNIIINTAPELVLGKKELDNVRKCTYILDVASMPGGVDFDYANKLYIKNNHLLGIPGNVAPKTAGEVLTKQITKVIKGDKNG